MNDALLLFLTVPAITAFIGYVTNWAAIKMVFHPRIPWGIGPLKWQGIIYRLAPKFAAEIATTTGHVLSPEDLVGRLEVDVLLDRLVTSRPEVVDEMLNDTLEVLAPGVWAGMSPQARDQIRALVIDQLGGAVSQAIMDMGERAEDLIDLDRLVVEELSGPNADRLARVAQEVGSRELRFIELYGGVFGFVVGVIQAAAYSWFSQWWTMPIVGVLVGLGTNWLAIQMIFRPLEPTRFLGLITYQGMFPKRQPEIARDYGRICAQDVLTPANLIDHVIDNPAAAVLSKELLGLAGAQVEQFAPMLASLTGSTPTTEQIEEVGDLLIRRVTDLAVASRPEIEAHLAHSLKLDELIEGRLAVLDRQQFERMLRGIFEEDEVILVIIGGVLGGAVGALQGAVVLGAGW